jgi:hypothetical protein
VVLNRAKICIPTDMDVDNECGFPVFVKKIGWLRGLIETNVYNIEVTFFNRESLFEIMILFAKYRVPFDENILIVNIFMF